METTYSYLAPFMGMGYSLPGIFLTQVSSPLGMVLVILVVSSLFNPVMILEKYSTFKWNNVGIRYPPLPPTPLTPIQYPKVPLDQWKISLPFYALPFNLPIIGLPISAEGLTL